MSETAIRADAIDPYFIRARAICREPLDVPACAAYLRQKDFLAAIQPWQKLKLQVYSASIPKIIVYSDERLESSYELPAEMQKILDDCDRHIQEEAALFGLPSQPGESR